jgi:purine-binding chemotaxis protein CheW
MIDELITAVDLMPKAEHELELLQSRARKLAENLASAHKAEQQQHYLQFKLDNNALYGIPQTMLDEVVYPQHLVNLAWLPAFISGVVSWKGVILTVLDGNYLCTKQSSMINELSRIIVLTYQGQSMGLLVNELCNFVNYKPSQLKTSLQSPLKFNSDYFLGLLDYSVIFLNVAAIFNDPSLRIAHQ